VVLEQDRVTLLPATAPTDITGFVEVETAIASLALEPAPSRAPAVEQLETGCSAVAAAGGIVMPLELRRCRRGDRVRLLNSPGAKSVHRILQSRRVPERLRGDWPVVSDARGIVWIPGVGVAERGRVVAATETALRFHWRPREAAPVGLRNPIQVLTLE
jgi:tRNA(Ile)-lysidine synthetase-like protein